MLNQRIFISIRRHLPIGRRSPYNVHLVFFSIMGIAFLLVMAPLFFMVGLSLLGKSAATLALAIVLNLGLLRMGMPGFWAQTIFQSLMIGTLLFCAWHTGGVSSPVLVFMSIVPLLPAYTTRNRHWVLFWLTIAFFRLRGYWRCNLPVSHLQRRKKTGRPAALCGDVLRFVHYPVEFYFQHGSSKSNHGAENKGIEFAPTTLIR